jgi:putative aldouronate transport system substrate-binding protein
MKRKKLLCMLLAAMFLLFFAISGCQQAEESEGKKEQELGKGDIATDDNLTPAGTFPVVKNTETLTIVRLTFGEYYDHETNCFTKYYEEKTNVKVEFLELSDTEFKDRVSMMLASSDPIDFIATANNSATVYSKTEQMKLHNQGVIVPLTDLIDKYSVWLKKELEATEGWQDFITGPEGEIYAFPALVECFHCSRYNKMWLNTAWLDNLKMEIPETTDQYYEVLKAFKEKDANGNGDPNDEIPFASAIGGLHHSVDGYFMCSFIYCDGYKRLNVNNGKVIAAFVQPEYREGLRYMNKLYSEGLIYPETFTQDRNTLRQLNSQKYESVVGSLLSPHHVYIGNREGDEEPRWFEYMGIAPLKGPNGVRTTAYHYYDRFQCAGFIPAAAKNPALVMRFLDWMYSEEGSFMMKQGPEGITWEKPKPGAVGVDGKPAKWQPIIMTEEDEYFGNAIWGAVFPHIARADFWGSQVGADSWYAQDEKGNYIGVEKYLWDVTEENYVPYTESLKNILPPLYFPLEDVEEIAQLEAVIYPYVEESLARFVTGDASIDGDWDAHLAELKKLGLDRYLELVQKAYDLSSFSK